jgi:hypothetical protein
MQANVQMPQTKTMCPVLCPDRGETGTARLKERTLAIGERRVEVMDSRHLYLNDQFATGKCVF